ncbi:MAG: diguanylate cyclase [Acidobacteria bacterium]|nr:diguanylate cyclase [Acidobacteriota bacterium]
MRILVADDSVVSRRLLEVTLKKWGYETVSASDGTQAWDVLKRDDTPQLAILDWVMPGFTGPEVCQNVRQVSRDRYVYIILLTSKSLKDDLIQGMNAGADDYLTKPFDPTELQVRLRAGRRVIDLQTELVAAREALREQATHDALTHLLNRASVLEVLTRELGRAEREESPMSMVICDLDKFKSVNDRFGHLAGDAVLKQAARRMQTNIRTYDSVGRYGGEEFIVVLPGCDAEAAAGHAERLRAALEAEPMDLGETVGGSIQVTASFGVASVGGRTYTTPQALLHCADEALYESKRAGRNRVTVWNPAQAVQQDQPRAGHGETVLEPAAEIVPSHGR